MTKLLSIFCCLLAAKSSTSNALILGRSPARSLRLSCQHLSWPARVFAPNQTLPPTRLRWIPLPRRHKSLAPCGNLFRLPAVSRTARGVSATGLLFLDVRKKSAKRCLLRTAHRLRSFSRAVSGGVGWLWVALRVSESEMKVGLLGGGVGWLEEEEGVEYLWLDEGPSGGEALELDKWSGECELWGLSSAVGGWGGVWRVVSVVMVGVMVSLLGVACFVCACTRQGAGMLEAEEPQQPVRLLASIATNVYSAHFSCPADLHHQALPPLPPQPELKEPPSWWHKDPIML